MIRSLISLFVFCSATSAASAAESTSILSCHRVCLIKRVAPLALDGDRLTSRQPFTAKDVLSPCCGFQVVWIYTESVAAEMVEALAGRYRPVSENVRNAVGKLIVFVEEDAVAVTASPSLPLPAPFFPLMDKRPELLDGAPSECVMAGCATKGSFGSDFIRPSLKLFGADFTGEYMLHGLVIPYISTEDKG